MERIAPPASIDLAADLASPPHRRWSDGPNYPWSLAMDDDWAVAAHWPALVAVLCEEVARGTESIGRELERLEADERLDRVEADAITASAQSMRDASVALQQIVRLGAGAFRPCPERIDLARLARQVAHERLREFLRRGAEIGFDIDPAEVLMDGSVAERMVNVSLDWALSFSRRVRLRIESDGMQSVRMVVRATLPRPSQTTPTPRGVPRRERRMNDNLHWVLLRQLAACSQLPVSRSSTAATESAVIQFPGVRAMPGAMAGAGIDLTRPPRT